ncbi:CybS-domain-containing protein [Chytriomyces sp. MP71]|nr:CybS-domain-containing protein [Chytriomyces sp. MP71]
MHFNSTCKMLRCRTGLPPSLLLRRTATRTASNTSVQGFQSHPHLHPASSNQVPKPKAHGSEHWTIERFLTVITIPLVGSGLAFGPLWPVDYGLAILLPIHTHLGFGTMIQDYLPERRNARVHRAATWALRITTGLVVYALVTFNMYDVGVTAFVQRLWTGQSARRLKGEMEGQ